MGPPELESQDVVSGFCVCGNVLCTYLNAWLQISTTYFTYEYPELYTEQGLVPTHPPRSGSKDSELEGCTMLPLNCKTCNVTVGVKCIEAAAGRLKYK